MTAPWTELKTDTVTVNRNLLERVLEQVTTPLDEKTIAGLIEAAGIELDDDHVLEDQTIYYVDASTLFGLVRLVEKVLQPALNILQEKNDELRALLAEKVEPVPPFGSKRAAAMAVYTPPFDYQHGYIFDSQRHMVADNGSIGDDEPNVRQAVAARVRGWGRLGYMPNGAELQDEIGQMMADALNKLYSEHP